MEEDTSVKYDDKFYKKRRSKHRAARKYMKSLIDMFGPFESALDLGAGDGFCAHVLAETGTEAHMVELSEAVLPYAFKDTHCRIHDLTEPLYYGRTFDLVMCVEVAEHLPESAADTLCDTIARHVGRVLIFTAAHQKQRGGGHVNLQPSVYWFRKLRDRNLIYLGKETRDLQDAWGTVLGKGFRHLQENVRVWGVDESSL